MIPGQQFRSTFQVTNSGGALANADVTPTVAVYREGTLTAVVVTVSSSATGIYSYEFTVPSNWNAGEVIDVHLNGTVDSQAINSKAKMSVVDPDALSADDIAQNVWEYDMTSLTGTARTLAGRILEDIKKRVRFIQFTK